MRKNYYLVSRVKGSDPDLPRIRRIGLPHSNYLTVDACC
jgi:hypothetical protein